MKTNRELPCAYLNYSRSRFVLGLMLALGALEISAGVVDPVGQTSVGSQSANTAVAGATEALSPQTPGAQPAADATADTQPNLCSSTQVALSWLPDRDESCVTPLGSSFVLGSYRHEISACCPCVDTGTYHCGAGGCEPCVL